jgi:trehalose 6-phosphate synthase/phosphatase
MVNSLEKSLTMPFDEKEARFHCNLEFCLNMTALKWAENVLFDLKNIQCVIEPCSATTLGLGTNFHHSQDLTISSFGFSTLDISKLCKSYRLSTQRLIVLDWDGTLVDSVQNFETYAFATGNLHSNPHMTPELKEILATLARDAKNHIFVISRRDMHTMTQYFGSIDGLGLAAEHGCYYFHPKGPIQNSHIFTWQSMMSFDDRTWMDAVKKVMEMYTQRTHGSYIDEKESVLIWQFDDADPEFGLFQSQELEEHLSDILSNHPLEVTRGSGYLEIRPAGLSKGLFLQHMLAVLSSRGIQIDFLLTMGNDSSDEEMFEVTNLTQATMKSTCSSSNCFSIAVGKRISAANYYVNTPEDAREVLQSLLRTSKLGRVYQSALVLPTHSPFGFDQSHVLRIQSASQGSLSRISGESSQKTSPNPQLEYARIMTSESTLNVVDDPRYGCPYESKCADILCSDDSDENSEFGILI